MRHGVRALSAALTGLVVTSIVAYSALSQAPASASAATVASLRAGSKKAAAQPVKAAVPEDPAYAGLRPLRVTFINTRRSEELRLYDAFGQVDESAARKLDALLGDAHDPKHYVTTVLDRRTLQLLFKAAYHFRAHEVEVVSAYRKPGRRRQGNHGTGQAIDFRLEGVKAAELAAYLRKLPRVGVGIYTHPRTQFVHLDVRTRSFHWMDGSPPGRNWRERSLGGKAIPTLDAVYTRSSDWPEGLTPPQVPFDP
jgi:uncharacterized protein YcbK (DUF882 family)